MQMAEVNERLRRGAIADVQVLCFEPQRVGIETDGADADWTIEACRDLYAEYMPEDHRDDQEAQNSEEYEEGNEADDQPPEPSHAAQCGRSRPPRPGFCTVRRSRLVHRCRPRLPRYRQRGPS